MREMTDKEQVMYDILKNNPKARKNNYEAVREWYRQVYGINLPSLEKCEEQYATVERWIRLLKSLYPSELTDDEERKLKADLEEQFKEKALDKNKPVKKETQGTLGLFGENPFGGWW